MSRSTSVHQHTAPYIDGDAYELLDNTILKLSRKAIDGIAQSLATAATKAASELQPFDSIGLGNAEVQEVASARRLLQEDGTVLTRFSTSGKDPKLAAMPEGAIDRTLRTVTFARAGKPLARIHLYATHPQTFCCDGRVTANFVGTARETLERESAIPQIYLNGCGGDVTVGKYNDASDAARARLAKRLLAAMRASSESTAFTRTTNVAWSSTPLSMPPVQNKPQQDAYRAAITKAFIGRKEPMEMKSLEAGPVQFLFLPGEPMLEFSRFARSLGREVLVAGYGDISPGYLCTDQAYRQGGYEPSASNVRTWNGSRAEERNS